MNPLINVCFSLNNCNVHKADLKGAFGRLRRMGFDKLEELDSAECAESLLGAYVFEELP